MPMYIVLYYWDYPFKKNMGLYFETRKSYVSIIRNIQIFDRSFKRLVRKVCPQLRGFTFWNGVKCDASVGNWAWNGGDVDDAASSGDGGPKEEGLRELAEMEARFQISRHQLRVIFSRPLHGRLQRHLPGVVHLHQVVQYMLTYKNCAIYLEASCNDFLSCIVGKWEPSSCNDLETHWW